MSDDSSFDDRLNETGLIPIADLRGSQKDSGLYFILMVIEGINFGCVFQLDKPNVVVGRKDAGERAPVDIELDDDRASRRHMRIVKRQLDSNANISKVFVTDLGSKNGTYVNGQRISATEIPLHNNDKIQIGNTVLKVEIKDNLDNAFQERLYQQVTRDPLTGLWNHNYVLQELEKLISQGKRNNWPFSIIILEIDFFQTLSETYGNNVGDAVLRASAQRIAAELNDYEIPGRLKGGNQFIILLPETDMAGAVSIAERVRQTLENFDCSALGCPQRVTLTGGVAQFPICGNTVNELLKEADEALYRAKQIGRNRIMAAQVAVLKSSNTKKKILPVLAALLVISLLAIISIKLYPVIFKPQKPQLIFSGVVETNEIEVASKVGGRITEIMVQEGNLVKAKQPIMRFDTAELLAERKLLEARMAEAKANLKKLENGFRPEEIEEAEATARREKAILAELRNGPRKQEIAQVKADLSVANSDLENAQLNLARVKSIFSSGYMSKQELDDAENRGKIAQGRADALKQKLSLLEEGTRIEEVTAAEENYAQAMAKVKLLHGGSRSEDISAMHAQIDAIKAEIEKVDIKISEGELLSPADSRIETISVRPGDVIPADKPVAKLLEQSQTWVMIYVPQTEIGMVKVGQKAAISIDSYPNQTFPGNIEKVGEEAEFYPRNVQTHSDREHQVFAVKVHIDTKDGILKSGMSADVTLER